jgi:DNA ligase-1
MLGLKRIKITYFKEEIMKLKLLLILYILISCSVLSAQELQLANSYKQQTISDYLVSEKLDGVRAIWRNNTLITRSGKLLYPPKWFTEKWPDTWLDGELWSKRQDFEFIASTVLDKDAIASDWQQISFNVFDMPNKTDPFLARYQSYLALTAATHSAYLKPVIQHTFKSDIEFDKFYQDLLNQGAEGVILHNPDSPFINGRSDNLLKLKPHQDSQATVIGYSPGKGKYKGRVGALIVRLDQHIEFKIGSGLSDDLRQNPPPIGSVIIFRHNGLTKYGKPRFARYLGLKTAN